MKTITYDGVTYHCTLTDRFRRHTDAERDAMRESIMADGVGVRHPIRVYRDTTLGLPNCVLDGEGRLEIVAACGYGGAPFHDEGELTTDEAYELAKVDNDHRRQDDPEAVRKRRVERVAVKRSEGKSLQVIADEEQVSKSQVRRDIEEAKSQPVEESEHRTVPPPAQLNPKKVVGKDGKTRTATPKKSAAPPVSAELVGKVAAALRKNPAATDHDLTTLTGCTPAEAKAARKAAKKLTAGDEPEPEAGPEEHPAEPTIRRLNVLCRRLDECKAEAEQIAADPFGRHVHLESVAASIDAARKALWQSRPTEPCARTPECGSGGGACKACYGTGRTTAARALRGAKA
jgi:hypothetical protein